MAFTVPGGQGQGRQLLVRRWNGSSWDAVGTGALNESAAHDAIRPRLVLDAGGLPAVAFQEVVAYGHLDLNVKRWDGGAWTLAGGAAPAILTSDPGAPNHGLAMATDGRLAAAWIDDAKALHARLLESTGWGADEAVAPTIPAKELSLVVGPDGLWAAFGTDTTCHAARRTDAGWIDVGPTDSPYVDSVWCDGGPAAAGPTYGPVMLFRNSAPGATDLAVYAVNR